MAARPPLPAPPYEGGCLCGAMRYRKRADSGREIDICRCARCGARLYDSP